MSVFWWVFVGFCGFLSVFVGFCGFLVVEERLESRGSGRWSRSIETGPRYLTSSNQWPFKPKMFVFGRFLVTRVYGR